MRRFVIDAFVLVALIAGLWVGAKAQAPVITSPAAPSGCTAGSTIAFSATGAGITWSVTGGGSINPATGVYTCPTVHPQNQSRGCQILPTATAYNQRIDSLPVNPHSANWLSRLIGIFPGTAAPTYHNIKPSISTLFQYYDNPVTNATPTQIIHASLGGPFDNTAQPMPTPPNARAQFGRSYQNGDNQDHHMLRTNTDTCSSVEQYQMFQDFENVVFTAGNPTLVAFDSNQIYTAANPQQTTVANAPSGCWSVINGTYPGVRTITGTTTSTSGISATYTVANPGTSIFANGDPVKVAGFSSTAAEYNVTGVISSATPTSFTVLQSSCGSCSFDGVSTSQTTGTAKPSNNFTTVIDRTHFSIPVDTSACGVPSPQPIMCSNGGCTVGSQSLNTTAIAIFKVDSPITPFGTNAGHTSINGFSIKNQEFYDAVQKCTAASNCGTADIGHAILTTLSNTANATYSVWPSVVYSGFYGTQSVTNGTWNGSATVFTAASMATIPPCPDGTATVGCTFGVLFLGTENGSTGTFPPAFSGSWAALNNTGPFDSIMHTATLIDSTHFSIPDNSSTWGAQTPSPAHFYFDFTPYGGWFRLPSSFNNNLVCTAAQTWTNYCLVYLNTMKHYGAVMMDGTIPAANWVMGSVGSEFYNPDMGAAQSAISTYFKQPGQYWDSIVEAVDTSSIQLHPGTPTDMATTTGRTIVTATNGSGSDSLDVYPQGTAVGVFPEYIAVTTGTTYQIQPWVTGNTNHAFTCSMSPAITGASVTSGCLFTAPPLGTYYSGAIPNTIVTITSTGDSNAKAYVSIDIMPVSSDGAIRILSSGNQLPASAWTNNYTDSGGFVWNGPVSNSSVDLGVDASGTFNNAGQIGYPVQVWTNPLVDPNLYWSVYETSNDDTINRFAVANGTYTVTIYGSSQPFTYTAGTTYFDWELNGVVVASYQDPWILSGSVHNAGWSLTNTVTVSNGILESGIRNRYAGAETPTPSPYGTLVGATKISAPTSSGFDVLLNPGVILKPGVVSK